jgi:hypothetical protein
MPRSRGSIESRSNAFEPLECFVAREGYLRSALLLLSLTWRGRPSLRLLRIFDVYFNCRPVLTEWFLLPRQVQTTWKTPRVSVPKCIERPLDFRITQPIPDPTQTQPRLGWVLGRILRPNLGHAEVYALASPVLFSK